MGNWENLMAIDLGRISGGYASYLLQLIMYVRVLRRANLDQGQYRVSPLVGGNSMNGFVALTVSFICFHGSGRSLLPESARGWNRGFMLSPELLLLVGRVQWCEGDVTFGSDTDRREFDGRSQVRTHAQSRVDIERVPIRQFLYRERRLASNDSAMQVESRVSHPHRLHSTGIGCNFIQVRGRGSQAGDGKDTGPRLGSSSHERARNLGSPERSSVIGSLD